MGPPLAGPQGPALNLPVRSVCSLHPLHGQRTTLLHCANSVPSSWSIQEIDLFQARCCNAILNVYTDQHQCSDSTSPRDLLLGPPPPGRKARHLILFQLQITRSFTAFRSRPLSAAATCRYHSPPDGNEWLLATIWLSNLVVRTGNRLIPILIVAMRQSWRRIPPTKTVIRPPLEICNGNLPSPGRKGPALNPLSDASLAACSSIDLCALQHRFGQRGSNTRRPWQQPRDRLNQLPYSSSA